MSDDSKDAGQIREDVRSAVSKALSETKIVTLKWLQGRISADHVAEEETRIWGDVLRATGDIQ